MAQRPESRRTIRRSGAGARPRSRTAGVAAPEGGRRQQWTRVVRSRTDAVVDRLSPAQAGAVAGLWAAILGLLGVGAVVLIAWIVGAGTGSFSGMVHSAGNAWLGVHHVPLSISGGSITALPLGLLAIPLLLAARSGQWAARRSGTVLVSEARTVIGMGAGVYATVGLLVASMSRTDSVWVSPLYALVGAGLVSAVGLGFGVLREASLLDTVTGLVPGVWRLRVRAATAACLVIVAAAGVVMAASLLLHFGGAVKMTQLLNPGLLGDLLLFVLAATYLPNLLVWAASFILGPGFALGEGTQVSPLGVDLGTVPAFPMFAGIPEQVPAWTLGLPAIGILAGVVMMIVMSPTEPMSLRRRAAWRERGMVLGTLIVIVFCACLLAGGGLGAGRMATTGPVAWQTALAAGVLAGIGGLIGDCVRHVRQWYRSRKMPDAIDVTDQQLDLDVASNRKSRLTSLRRRSRDDS